MFKRIRVAFLLYILAFVALRNYLASARSTDWQETLWVDVYPINADGSPLTQAYIDGLDSSDLERIETYFAKEAERYGISLWQPFRLELGPQIDKDIPQLAETPSILNTLLWSLRMRWFAARVDPGAGRPTPDIKLFALYFDENQAAVLDRSTALNVVLSRSRISSQFARARAKTRSSWRMNYSIRSAQQTNTTSPPIYPSIRPATRIPMRSRYIPRMLRSLWQAGSR
ncbi:MAG: hypothetical protein ACJ0SL_02690 [Candidatus Rariloculaceae bacterium]